MMEIRSCTNRLSQVREGIRHVHISLELTRPEQLEQLHASLIRGNNTLYSISAESFASSNCHGSCSFRRATIAGRFGRDRRRSRDASSSRLLLDFQGSCFCVITRPSCYGRKPTGFCNISKPETLILQGSNHPVAFGHRSDAVCEGIARANFSVGFAGEGDPTRMLQLLTSREPGVEVGRNELPAQSLVRRGRPGHARVLQLRLEESKGDEECLQVAFSRRTRARASKRLGLGFGKHPHGLQDVDALDC